jgi:hypothetical protein
MHFFFILDLCKDINISIYKYSAVYLLSHLFTYLFWQNLGFVPASQVLYDLSHTSPGQTERLLFISYFVS